MIEPEILRHATLLVAADGKRNTSSRCLPGLVETRQGAYEVARQDVLQKPRDPVRVALDGVTDNTLVHIMALMLFGQADHGHKPTISFVEAQAEARRRFEVSGRARTARYVQSKPLSRFLLAGIARMQRESSAHAGSIAQPAARTRDAPAQQAPGGDVQAASQSRVRNAVMSIATGKAPLMMK